MRSARSNHPGWTGEAPLRYCVLRLYGFAGIVVQDPNGLGAAPICRTEDWA
jgi:hypothetical protein